MAPKIGFELEPTVNQAALRQVFDALKANGVAAANEVAKRYGFTATASVVVEVKDGKLVQTLKESVREVDQLNSELKRSDKIQAGSITSLRQALNTYKQQRDATSKFAQSTNEYGKRVSIVNKEWEVQNQKVQQVNRALQLASANSFWDRVKVGLNLQGLQSFAQGISNIVNGFQSLSIIVQQVSAVVNTLINALKGVEQIGLTFQAIGQGAAGGQKALEESSRIALNLGVDLNTVREGFLKLSPVILQSGGSLDEVSKITQALSSRFAAFGKSADEAKRITNAVIQAFGKGALRSEELNQQIAEADQAFRVDFANALGVTVQKFGEMVEAGEITNAVLLKTLPLLDKSTLVYGKLGTSALDAASAFGTLGVTTQQIQSKIATINQLSLEQLANTFKPVTKVILQLQGVVTDLFASLAKNETAEALANILATISGGFLEFLKVLTKLIQILLKVIDPLANLLNRLLAIEPVAKALGVIIAGLLIAALAKATIAAILFSVSLGNSAKALLGLGTAAGSTSARLAAFAAGGGKGAGVLGVVDAISTATLGAGGKVLGFGKALITGKASLGSFVQGAKSAAGGLKNVGSGIVSTAQNWKIYAKAAQNAGGRAAASAKLLEPFNRGLVNAGQGARTAAGTTASYTQRLGAAYLNLSRFGKVAAIAGKLSLVTTAIQTTYGAIEDYTKSTAAANAVNERTKKQLADAASVYKTVQTALGATAKATETTADRQGGLSRAIQGTVNWFGQIIPGWQNINSEAASYNMEILATIEGQDKFNTAMAKNIKLFQEYAAKSKGTAEDNKKLADTTDILLQQYDANGTALKAQLEALQNEKAAREDSNDERETAIAVIQAEINANNANRKALLSVAAAAGVDVFKYSERGKQATAMVEKLREEVKAIEERNKALIQKAEETRDEEIAKIDKAAEAITKKNNREIGGYERTIAAAQKRYAAEDQAIERTRQLRDRAYNAEIAKLDKLAAAVSKVYDARVRGLQGPTAAESQLAALDKAELQKQAANAETQRERLQARAQLERLEREKQIAALQAQKEKELEAIAQEKAKKEEARAAELLKREEDDYARKIKRQQEIGASQDEIDKRREENRKTEEKAEDDREAAIKRYEAIVLPLQDGIKAKMKELKTAEVELQKERDIYNTKMARSLTIADNILNKERLINQELRNRPNPGPSPSPTSGGTYRGGQRGSGSSPSTQGVWAGGPVSGGTTYTVNELGREAFLSNTGKLSHINTPAWGQWTAPGAGTVIPAHITAGLTIPSGGMRVSSGATAAVRSSSTKSDNSLAKALGMALGGAQGRVTNNVTIQSENPTRSASDILVQLTKIKRNRYR